MFALHATVSFFKIMFVCLFLAVLGLRCFEGFSLVPASRGYSLLVVHGLLIRVASLVAEHELLRVWAQELWFPGFRTQAQ